MNGKELLNFANKLEDDHKDKGYKWLYDKLRYEIIKKHQDMSQDIEEYEEKEGYVYVMTVEIIDGLAQITKSEFKKNEAKSQTKKEEE